MGTIKGKTPVAIKLNSVGELKTDIAEIKTRFDSIEKDGVKLASMLAEAAKFKLSVGQKVQGVVSLSTAVKADIDGFLTKAKELGLDASSSKEVKELQSLLTEIKEYQAWYNGIGTIPNL